MIYDAARSPPHGPRIYGVVAGMSVAKPVYRKTAAVVVRNNYCSDRRARLRTRLQGVFYARTVNSRETRRTESRTSEFVLVAGDELRAVKLFLPLKSHPRSVHSCFGYIKSLAKLSAMRFTESYNYVETYNASLRNPWIGCSKIRAF